VNCGLPQCVERKYPTIGYLPHDNSSDKTPIAVQLNTQPGDAKGMKCQFMILLGFLLFSYVVTRNWSLQLQTAVMFQMIWILPREDTIMTKRRNTNLHPAFSATLPCCNNNLNCKYIDSYPLSIHFCAVWHRY
jgi:hypothetical protein